VAITSYGSSDHSSDQCHPRLQRHWFRCSFRVAWTATTATRSDESVAVGPECGYTFGVGCLVNGTTTSRHWLPVRRWVVFKMATLVYRYLSLSGMAPASLAAKCQLVSAIYHIKDVCCQTDLQQLWR